MSTPIAAIVTEAAIGPVAAALARIEDLAARLESRGQGRKGEIAALRSAVQTIRESITLIDDTPKENEGE